MQTYRGINVLTTNSTRRKRTYNYNDNMFPPNSSLLNLTPISITSSLTNKVYKSSSSTTKNIINENNLKNMFPTSSLNFNPVNITTSKKNSSSSSIKSYDIIDIASIINNNDISSKKQTTKTTENNNEQVNFRKKQLNRRNELLDIFKWCLYCMAAFSSCIIFVSYLYQIQLNRNNFSSSNSNNYYYHLSIPHHKYNHKHSHHLESSQIFDSAQFTHSQIMSIGSSYVNSLDNSINYNKYNHFIRNDKYSILNDILFVVFRSPEQDDHIDGRSAIMNTWAKSSNKYTINILFVNTKTQKFAETNDDDENNNIISPPFEGDSAQSLLYVIDTYGNDYEWIFSLDDISYVMIENLVDYLNCIEVSSSSVSGSGNHINYNYYWWLGNSININSGYLINKPIINLIISDLNKTNQNNNKYMMCSYTFVSDLCISYLLNNKYGILASSTLDCDNNEKFNIINIMDDPIITQKITSTPLTFHYIKPAWMSAYYKLFKLHYKSKDIDIISNYYANNNNKLKYLDNYAKIVEQYSVTNHIKNINNEMKQIQNDKTFNLVK